MSTESHMHLECMSRMILDTGLYQVNFGLLEIPQLSEDAPFSLPASFIEVVKWHYIRIASKAFQKVIRCASVIGRVFSIDELYAVWPDVYPSQQRNQNAVYLKQWILGLIMTQDYFDFFEAYTDVDDDTVNPNLLSSSTFKFRYRAIKTIVHNEILTANEKSMRHKNLILYYERQINLVTEPVYIPLITYHYSVTFITDRTSILKRIRYLVMLGIYLCQSTESYMEARAIFKEIQRILDKYEMHEQLGQNLSVKWHAQVAIAHSHGPPICVDINKSLEHVKVGMKLLDQPWPETDRARRALLFRHAGIIISRSWNCLFSPIQLPQKPRSARTTSQVSIFHEDSVPFADLIPTAQNKKTFNLMILSSRESDRLRELETFLSVLSDILPKTNTKLIDQVACDVLSLSVALRLHSNNVKKPRTRLFISLALKLWFLGKVRTSIFLFKRASKDLYSRKGTLNAFNCPYTVTLSTTFLVVCGKWELAGKHANEGMNHCLSQGKLALVSKITSSMYQ